jgi:hypothetical protein
VANEHTNDVSVVDINRPYPGRVRASTQHPVDRPINLNPQGGGGRTVMKKLLFGAVLTMIVVSPALGGGLGTVAKGALAGDPPLLPTRRHHRGFRKARSRGAT